MAVLKHSAADWCFLKAGADAAAYYRAIRAMGYGGAEMVEPGRIGLARDAGLEVLNAIAPGIGRGLADRSLHGELLPQIRGAIDAARKNGVPNLVVFSGSREGRESAEAISAVAEGLRAVAPYARDAGVTLQFEALNSYDHVDYFATTTPVALEILRQAGSADIQLVFDIYHMARMGEDTPETLMQAFAKVGHIHTAASPGRGVPTEGGEIPYERIVKAVRKAGYKGYWGHEFLPSADILGDMRKCLELFEKWAG